MQKKRLRFNNVPFICCVLDTVILLALSGFKQAVFLQILILNPIAKFGTTSIFCGKITISIYIQLYLNLRNNTILWVLSYSIPIYNILTSAHYTQGCDFAGFITYMQWRDLYTLYMQHFLKLLKVLYIFKTTVITENNGICNFLGFFHVTIFTKHD